MSGVLVVSACCMVKLSRCLSTEARQNPRHAIRCKVWRCLHNFDSTLLLVSAGATAAASAPRNASPDSRALQAVTAVSLVANYYQCCSDIEVRRSCWLQHCHTLLQ
jgi:hypothetical protein